MQRGGPEKIDDRPSQIDGPPLPLKNDSSLGDKEGFYIRQELAIQTPRYPLNYLMNMRGTLKACGLSWPFTCLHSRWRHMDK